MDDFSLKPLGDDEHSNISTISHSEIVQIMTMSDSGEGIFYPGFKH